MSCQATTRKFEDISVVYLPVSFTMEESDIIGTSFDKAATYAMKSGAEIIGSFLLYGECTEEVMNGDCCIAVKTPLPEGDGVRSKTVPGGEFLAAQAVHKGSYEGIGNTWGLLMEWIDQQGYTFSGLPMREIYLNSPAQVPERELLTEIVVPVQKA